MSLSNCTTYYTLDNDVLCSVTPSFVIDAFEDSSGLKYSFCVAGTANETRR